MLFNILLIEKKSVEHEVMLQNGVGWERNLEERGQPPLIALAFSMTFCESLCAHECFPFSMLPNSILTTCIEYFQ